MNDDAEKAFLNSLNKDHLIQIFLVSGIKMVGTLLNYDDYTILISGKTGSAQMIYKHAIATLSIYHEDKKG